MSIDYSDRTSTVRLSAAIEQKARKELAKAQARSALAAKGTPPANPDYSDCNTQDEKDHVAMGGIASQWRSLENAEDDEAIQASLSAIGDGVGIKLRALAGTAAVERRTPGAIIDEHLAQQIRKRGLNPKYVSTRNADDLTAK